MKASTRIGDVVVTLSIAEDVKINPEDEAETHAFLEKTIDLVAAQTRSGMESELHAAIMRGIAVYDRKPQ